METPLGTAILIHPVLYTLHKGVTLPTPLHSSWLLMLHHYARNVFSLNFFYSLPCLPNLHHTCAGIISLHTLSSCKRGQSYYTHKDEQLLTLGTVEACTFF